MSKDKIQNNLNPGLEVTKNTRGFMHQLNEISQEFIDFVTPDTKGLIIDMGAAYGVATIPILNKHIKVLACDSNNDHLEELRQRVDPSLQKYLTTQAGYFPQDFNFASESVGAILLSHILHFLSPNELDKALDKLSHWCRQGGKIFIICYTPYLAVIKDFLPLYEERLQEGIKWPYWVENNMRQYFTGNVEAAKNLPPTMNYLDIPLLAPALEARGFKIDEAVYLDPNKNHMPQEVRLDGREWCGIVATKV